MTLFDPPAESHPRNIIHAIFPWRFPRQPCRICLNPLDIEDSTTEYDVDVEGKQIGWRHESCPREGSQDAV